MKKKSIVAMGITILPLVANANNGIDVEKVASNANYPGTEVANLEAQVDSAINLQEVTINAHFVKTNETPLNLSTITPADIRLHQTAPNYLEMFQGIPGVYATPTTGS